MHSPDKASRSLALRAVLGAIRAIGVPLILILAGLSLAGLSLTSLSCGGEEETASTSASAGPDQGTGAGPGATESGAAVGLPQPQTEGSVSLEEAIHSRRSVRDFSPEPLSLKEVAQLLWAAQGITSPQGARAAPSAGGTYPLELYLAVGDVAGLEAGVYHYRPAEHQLERVAAGDIRTRLAEACVDQLWVAEAPADVIITAVYSRTTERYGERGIRYVHLEAGHAAQNLCLQAAALELGAVTVGAFSDKDVQALLGLADGDKNEQGEQVDPLYVIPVGHRAQEGPR